MALFLGVDAGGTKTEFLLADEHRELGRVRTGSIKRLRRDAATASLNLESALRQLTELTGFPMGSVTRCCVGAAGVTVPLVANWICEAFAPLVGGELLLVGDVDIALDAAFRGRRGVLILAGTGSNVAARASDGTTLTAGGWGPALADEGSGHFLGIEGLRRGFRALDEQRQSSLLASIQRHWQIASLADLVEFANTNPAPNFSELAPLVVACAAQGDAVAIEVVRRAGADLAQVAALAIERIRLAEAASGSGDFTPPPVAFAGSILEKVALEREALIETLRLLYPEIEVVEQVIDPAQGALWRARQAV